MLLYDFLKVYDGKLTLIRTDTDICFSNKELLFCHVDSDDIFKKYPISFLKEHKVYYFCIQQFGQALNVYVMEI